MGTGISAVIFFVLFVAAIPAWASGPDGKAIDQRSIDALAIKASLAQPRDQCFLYAELVHQMAEFSVRSYAAGDVERSAGLLRQMQKMANRIHLSMNDGDKRLKNAEIQLRQAAFRLTEMLHNSSYEDRPLVEQTLAQVNQAENEAMLQVFRK
jgi:hypothetical protein